MFFKLFWLTPRGYTEGKSGRKFRDCFCLQIFQASWAKNFDLLRFIAVHGTITIEFYVEFWLNGQKFSPLGPTLLCFKAKISPIVLKNGPHATIQHIVNTFDQEIELRVLRVQLKQELSKRYYILFHLLAFFSGSKTDQKNSGILQQIALSV